MVAIHEEITYMAVDLQSTLDAFLFAIHFPCEAPQIEAPWRVRPVVQIMREYVCL